MFCNINEYTVWVLYILCARERCIKYLQADYFEPIYKIKFD